MRLSFDEYQAGAAGTAHYPGIGVEQSYSQGESGPEVVWANYVYPTLGLCGEAGETATALALAETKPDYRDDIKKEMGDVLWYVAALCKEFGILMSSLVRAELFYDFEYRYGSSGLTYDNATLGAELCAKAALIAEQVKKAVRDDRGHIDPKRMPTIEYGIVEVLALLVMIGNKHSIRFEDVAQTNLDKLASRAARGVLGGSGDNR